MNEINESTINIEDIPEIREGIGNWYANIFRINRRKCVLFTNEPSLYSFLVPGLKKKELTNIKYVFLTNMKLNLQAEKIEEYIINKVVLEYNEIQFSKTNSRSILGSMNDMKYQYEAFTYSDPEYSLRNILYINKKVNRTPMSAIKYAYSIEKLKECINKNYFLH